MTTTPHPPAAPSPLTRGEGYKTVVPCGHARCEIALGFPGAIEKLSHGEPAFFTPKRMFATIDNNHHGSGHVAVWCKAPDGAQQSLVAGDPKHFFVPPYVGTAGWLGIRLDSGLPWPVIAGLLRQAYESARAGSRAAGSAATPRARRSPAPRR